MTWPAVSVMMPILCREDWQGIMTECAIRTLKRTTAMPFELVVVETARREKADDNIPDIVRDYFLPECKYIAVDKETSPARDCNIGLQNCTGEFVVYTGNDIFVRPGWLEALLKCFEIPDCGAATLASSDLKLPQRDLIQEGVYGPFMMFRRVDAKRGKPWLYDEVNFPCQFGDTDMIMRMYSDGLRMYRNHSVVIHHLNRQTLSGEDNTQDFHKARARFIRKHEGSPLLMYKFLTEGTII